MGRGKVQLKKIDNKVNRQVTFSKRKTGLVKKAHEISVLCDADVALIVFSHRGKHFQYCSDNSMEKILERYERYCYAEKRLHPNNDPDIQVNWTIDFAHLKAKAELLHRNHRQYMGQDLGSLNNKEIQSLELQLDTALKSIRARKNHLMHESICELQKKEKAMVEHNNVLAKEIKDREKNMAEVQQMQLQSSSQHQSGQGHPDASNFLLSQASTSYY
ncbi:hypothetical protein SOVF_046330 [Spinacia oleracea]|nr:hypothetical protein SOVF_046330 [Spinacia oleracea]